MSFEADSEIRQELRQHLGWAIALGILIILMGIIAVAYPLLTGILTTMVFGWVVLFGGICQAIYAFRTRKAGRFMLKLLLGMLYIVSGLILLFNPVASLAFLTLVLGIAILFQGIFQVILAFQLKPEPGWGWTLFSGMLGIILGILLWNQWPSTVPWLVGLLVAINLLTDGLWVILFSASARQVIRSA
jgi:uncharacterized membrane protein HdeD (DUF308 family)